MNKMNTSVKSIMFVGTGSDVGKSVIAAAFCRIFKEDGFHTAPFKAQNMSLNSYATPEGYEIGRAQAMQAEASGIPCSVEMNPILLKPNSEKEAQIVLNGKPWANQSAQAYFNGTDRDFLFSEAMKAYDRLSDKYSPIVIEGAGSISEVNLWDRDITNMKVALYAEASVYLIADIDKGGVFGSVYGTLELLPKEEREAVKGIIINKFRGDISLFYDGRKMLEELTGVPVVGVIPYFRDISLDEEDSVILDTKLLAHRKENAIKIVVVLLPHMSNFTDFNSLERLSEISFTYSANPQIVGSADIIIIPGSKNTISDLMFLRETGLSTAVLNAYDCGKSIYGICGGFQMMGKMILDPLAIESATPAMPGLGILPITTTLTADKTTEQCTFTFKNSTEQCTGYEIHMGKTESEYLSPLCKLKDSDDGFFVNHKVWGTYIHGIFDNSTVVQQVLNAAGFTESIQSMDTKEFKDRQYSQLAKLVRDNCDMDYIYSTIRV